MKRELFFLVLFFIGVVIWYEISAVEAFQVNIPKTNPQPAPIGADDPKPFAPTSDALLAPPPGQMASVNSYPTDNPKMKKAPAKYLANTLETLQGFLTNEAAGLKTSGDPTIQLPMETARSDLQRLQDEISVIKRNPGVEGSLTIGDLNDINANLAYLQKKWRLSANTEVPAAVEGFWGSRMEGFATAADVGSGSTGSGSTGSGSTGSGSTGSGSTGSGSTGSGSTGSAGSIPTGSGSTVGSGSTPPATITLKQLINLQTSIAAFITQLQVDGFSNRSNTEGFTDAVTKNRIDVLTLVLNKVTDLVNKVEAGLLAVSDIPITVAAYNAFLPFVDPSNNAWNQNSPLPILFNTLGIDPGLSNLFPTYFNGDASGAELAKELFKKYLPMLFQDVSYEVDLKFGQKSQTDKLIAQNVSLALSNTLLGNSTAVNMSDSDSGNTYGNATNMSTSSGEFGSAIHNLKNPTANANSPSTLDWKDRSNQICSQISKRGMSPYEYGCMADPNDVDANFSYRGYAKMVCSRLQTNYDPGIPEMCGCPPPTWSGWRP